MKTSLDCLPCFLRQSLEAARFITDDPGIHEQILRQVLRSAAEMELRQPPPVMARIFYRRLSEMSGLEDIYRPAKDRFNRLAMELAPELQRAFSDADLVIAKGQGNFETLSEEPAPVFFLFKVKCPVVASHVGMPLGTHVLLKGG